LQHLQVGRKIEIQSILGDFQRIQDGGAGFRLIIGPFGAGKTFFLHLTKAVALERRFVVVHADLNPDRRLAGTGGVARSLYQELMRNCATKAKPEGGALASVLERWIADAGLPEHPTPQDVRQRLRGIEDLVGGFDLAAVISAYVCASTQGKDETVSACLKWLRGEYTSKVAARQDLGVRTIVDDPEIYDYLKLWAAFVRLAGYQGLIVVVDEAINLYKLRHPDARNRNYETVLRIYNDCLQGGAQGIGVLIGGTPEFLRDTRRGLFSYEALRSRLAGTTINNANHRDLTGPVIELPNLSIEDLYVLLTNVRRIHAGDRPVDAILPDAGITAFIERCSKTLGDAFFRTPRHAVLQFVQILNILEQNPGLDWRDPLGKAVTTAAADTATAIQAEGAPPLEDDDLATFTLGKP
jgi:hypothetical protein